MIYLKIIDEKNQELDLNELTATGREMIYNECKELLNKLEEINKDE